MNTTDSAVRITHIPTGVVVSQQDEKSQHKNKAKALKILRARLYDAERSRQDAERSAARRGQVGTGDRSERIRTYNFPQGRVSDHRINLTLYKIDKVMTGEALDEFVEALDRRRPGRTPRHAGPGMSTQRSTLKEAVKRLKDGGVDMPVLDARLLLQFALGVDWAGLFTGPDRELSPEELRRIEKLIQRRLAREPISRIVGRRGFWKFDLQISPATLDPRPDTETLIMSVLKLLPDLSEPLSILDLGTGSGAILLSLLSELPQATGTGVDISDEAVATALRQRAGKRDADPRRVHRARLEPGHARPARSGRLQPALHRIRRNPDAHARGEGFRSPGCPGRRRGWSRRLSQPGGAGAFGAEARRVCWPSKSASDRPPRSRLCSQPPVSRASSAGKT